MDPDNILSTLMPSMMGSQDDSGPPPAPAPATNVLQAAAPAPASPPPSFQDPTAVAQAATDASPPMPKPKRSLLDTIGRISDVLAQVGGAAPLYQPTLDARSDRELALEDHARKVQMDDTDLATKKFDLTKGQTAQADDERSRFANVLHSIGGADDAANMPAMMAAAGLTDPRYAPFVKMVQDHPESAGTLASALGYADKSKLGHNLYFGTDGKGNTVAYQIGDDGQPHILDFSGSGVTPGEPSKVVNTGSSQVVVGSSTGSVKKILPVTVSPNTAATNATSERNTDARDKTQITIAGMPARNASGAGNSKGAVEDPNIPMFLQNIRQGFADLHGMGALPGDGGGALGQVEAAIGRSGIGQKIGEQTGNKAAQKRLEVVKNISQLQQAMLKSLPASATRTKFEQEMLARGLPDPAKMDYNTANTVIDQLYSSYQNALQASQRAQAPAAGGGNLPRLTPAQAAKLPSGTPFLGLDGKPRVRQ